MIWQFMVSAFITNVILHHRWAAPHNPPTYVNTRHRRRSGNRHKWKVLDMGRVYDDISLCSLKATRFPEMKTTAGALLYLQILDFFPLRSVFTAQFSSCFASLLISGLVTFARQTDNNHMFLPWPQLRKHNHYVPLWTGIYNLIRNTSS